jgi:glutaredoxin-related protein
MQKAVLAIVAVSLILFVGAIWSMSRKPTLDASGVTLFYSTTCVYCKQVEEYIKENKIDETMTISRKEISVPANMAAMNQAVEFCQVDATQGVGVPFLLAEGKCYMGGPDVEGYFRQKVGQDSEPTPSGETATESTSLTPTVVAE